MRKNVSPEVWACGETKVNVFFKIINYTYQYYIQFEI